MYVSSYLICAVAKARFLQCRLLPSAALLLWLLLLVLGLLLLRLLLLLCCFLVFLLDLFDSIPRLHRLQQLL